MKRPGYTLTEVALLGFSLLVIAGMIAAVCGGIYTITHFITKYW